MDAPRGDPEPGPEQGPPAQPVAVAAGGTAIIQSSAALTGVAAEVGDAAEASTALRSSDREPAAAQPTAPPGTECRICLLAEDPGTLVAPCGCIGTLQFAHLPCLKAWARERGSALCEICQSPYVDHLAAALAPDIAAGRRRKRARRAGGAAAAAPPAATAPAGEERGGGGGGGAEDAAEDLMGGCGRSSLVRVMLVLVLMGGAAFLLLFLGIRADDATWAAILLRVLAFALPLFIILKVASTCLVHRRIAAEESRLADRLPV